MKYRVIAIEREYASGGSEIGRKLGAKLGVPCYGQEILEMAAARLGVPVSDVQRQEETIPSSLQYSLHAISLLAASQDNPLTQPQRLALAEIETIRELDKLGPCVIVGRSAASALGDGAKVLKVFVRASHDARMRRAIEVYAHPADKAEAILRVFDKRRSRYYKALSGQTWGDPANYHVMLDSGALGIDAVVEALASLAGKE